MIQAPQQGDGIMFESLFTQPSAIARYRSAPLLKERLRYLAHCEQIGIKQATLRKIASHQMLFAITLDLQDVEGALILHKIEAWYRQWSSPKTRKSAPCARQGFFGHIERWLRFLDWRNEPKSVNHAHTREIAVFEAHISGELGWSDATVEGHCRAVDRFLSWLGETGVDLTSIGIGTIDRFIADYHARGYCRSTMHLYAQQLRGFFRFAEQQGWCKRGLADGIMPTRRYPGESVPKGLKRDEVIRLLATTEGDSPSDIRARAILMLLITYGLRAGEVSGLQLDDLDWEQEMLRVRCPKPGRTHLYPLSPGIGQVVLRYLREVRPAQHGRALFLTLKAPIKPVSRGVIKGLVSTRIDRLGVTGKRRGPHALRHAAAQHLLDQGLSMKAVGDYLGHRSITATSVYAKVQLSTLRDVADIDLEGLV
jgi:integrase/recombinase XerD